VKIAVVVPGLPLPVEGYGGIELAAETQAREFAERGHDVTVFCNTLPKEEGGWEPPFEVVRCPREFDPLSHLAELQAFDAVSDWSHFKALRFCRLKNYLATAMWTDINAPGRTVYPSSAVREAFKDPAAPVVPIGIKVSDLGEHDPEGESPGPWSVLGRITGYKGVDLSVKVLAERANGNPVEVAGHVGRFGDVYYAMTIEKICRDRGFAFAANPESLRPFLRRSRGLLHLHRWLESFSIVAAEALCLGVPILTTDQGAPQEWVRATDGGFVVPLDQLEKGIRPPALEEFFAENWKGRRAGIVKRARDLFDSGRVAAQYERLFERGLG